MRPQGSPAELERRRLRAIELLQRDVAVHVVADPVDGSGCTDDTVATGCVPAPPRVDPRSSAPRSAVDWRAWSWPGRKRPAIAPACGRVGASST